MGGLWAKVKGVFGRIGTGIKKGYNWIKDHFSTIKDVADKAKEFVPDKYRPAVDTALDKGFGTADKVFTTFGNIR